MTRDEAEAIIDAHEKTVVHMLHVGEGMRVHSSPTTRAALASALTAAPEKPRCTCVDSAEGSHVCRTCATPPVADDADALLDALESEMKAGNYLGHNARLTELRSAVRARMRPLGEQVTAILREADAMAAKRSKVIPWPTAEALCAEMMKAFDAGRTSGHLFGSIENVRAALSALQGGGK